MQGQAAAEGIWPAMSLAEAHARLTAPESEFAVTQATIRGIPTRIWAKAPPTLREVFLAGLGHGERTYLVHQDERASFTAFGRATLALAEALSEAGIGKGDRVAIAMRNLPEWPAAFFATVLTGAIATPLNAWWTGAELEYGLTHSGARAAFLDGERWQRLRPHLANCPALIRVFVSRWNGPLEHPQARPLESVTGTVDAWGELPERPLPQVALEPEDDATIFYTSGTTGRPKGAVGSHRAAASSVMAHAFSRARAFLRRGQVPPAADPSAPQKANLVAIPAFHVTGCHATLLPALYRGTKLVLMRRFEPEAAMRLIEREGCTNAGGVPTIAWHLAAHPARARFDLSSLESISYGGAPAAAELVRQIEAAFPRAVPATGWGMTETSATFTHHQAEEYRQRPESCGPALPVCEMRVIGPDGSELPIGQVGELWVKGPNVVRGYWNDPDATKEAFREGWLRTGDLARLDEEGFCTIVDRLKDMVIRGGENIYCIEVENALAEHPAVMEAAVLAMPHPSLGEEPAAVVALRDGGGADEAELRAFAALRLAAFKVPVRIVVHDRPLPRNPNGKILKSTLKALL